MKGVIKLKKTAGKPERREKENPENDFPLVAVGLPKAMPSSRLFFNNLNPKKEIH